jgi:ATP-dependent DNA helicase RecG
MPISAARMVEVDAALAAILAGASSTSLESSTLDFKEPKSSRGDTERMVADAMICFANAGGGVLVLGVRDKARGPEAFVGCGDMDPEVIQARTHALTQPPLTVDVLAHPSHPSLLLVCTEKANGVHADTQGRASRRINTDCLPLGPLELAALFEERRGADQMAESAGRLLADASPLALETARKMLARYSDHRKALSIASTIDLLSGIHATADRVHLNRAGELLFCECQEGAPQVELATYIYRDTPAGEPRSVERLLAPLLLAYDKVMALIQARSTSQQITLANGQQIAIEDFPLVAVRETLSNAICHRDYQTSSPVLIEHSPTVLNITSPGALPPGVTPQNIITTPSRTRNPAILKIVRSLGIAEELGSGVDRMIRAMVGTGRQLPEIAADSSRVRVTLVGGAANTALVRYVAQLPEAERDDTDTMLILVYLLDHKTVQAQAVAPILQKSEAEALSSLRRLASDTVELLEATQQSRRAASPTYRLRNAVLAQLGSAVKYNRKTIDDTDRKIIAHLREYKQITNKTVQNVFDVDVYRARNILTSLNQREIIVRISSSARGPNVVWGPGPKFPASRPRRPAKSAAPVGKTKRDPGSESQL